MTTNNSTLAREMLGYSQKLLDSNKQLLEDNAALLARSLQLCDELTTANRNQQQCVQTISDLQEQLARRNAGETASQPHAHPFTHPVARWLVSLVMDGLMEELPEHSRNAWWWTQAAVELLRCAHSAEIGGYPLKYYDDAPFEIWLDGPDKGFALTIAMPLWLRLLEHTPQEAAQRFTHPVARWMAGLDPATLNNPLPPEHREAFRCVVLGRAERVENKSRSQRLFFNSGYSITVVIQRGGYYASRVIPLPEEVRQAANAVEGATS